VDKQRILASRAVRQAVSTRTIFTKKTKNNTKTNPTTKTNPELDEERIRENLRCLL